MKTYAKLTTGIIAAWFLFALSASSLHWFNNDAGRIGGAVAIVALTPVVLFALWIAASPTFRQFALSLNPRILTAVQTWRLLGFIFLVSQARGILPAIFALPAGYGDIFIGATATLAAWKLANPNHRQSFIFWHALGITDLVLAVGLGTTAGLLSPHSTSMAAMTLLPLSLIPTFLVPLFLIFHIICIAQASSWKSAVSDARLRQAGRGVRQATTA
jgi:hypothetical protein